jgi:purine-nucleoside/S-methyl-5'-thioadenosine phosphorylase / adenosine deaminase
MEWREGGGVRWLEARLPGATAAFSTRAGGASDPPFNGLNLGVFTEDEREAVVENRVRLAVALGFEPERIAIGRQVHGAELATHSGPQSPSPFAEPGSPIPEVDGHVTAETSLALLVFVADCLPIALAGPGGVAMLHCGWRGLAAGIVARGVEAIGATDAAIGPGIGPCCYEVGEEVFAALREPPPTGRNVNPQSTFRPVGSIDLAAVAGDMLREVGVERVESSGLCTGCETRLFFSHRRDAGRTGRQAGLVWREGEAG